MVVPKTLVRCGRLLCISLCLPGCDKGDYSDVASSETPTMVKLAELQEYGEVLFALPCKPAPGRGAGLLRNKNTVFYQEFPDEISVSRYQVGNTSTAILTQEIPTEYAETKDYTGGYWELSHKQTIFIDNATDHDVQVTIDEQNAFTLAAKHHCKVYFYLGVHDLSVVNSEDSSVIDERKFLASKWHEQDAIDFLVYNVNGSNRYTCKFGAYGE